MFKNMMKNLFRNPWGKKKYTKRGRGHRKNVRSELRRFQFSGFRPKRGFVYQAGGATPRGTINGKRYRLEMIARPNRCEIHKQDRPK